MPNSGRSLPGTRTSFGRRLDEAAAVRVPLRSLPARLLFALPLLLVLAWYGRTAQRYFEGNRLENSVVVDDIVAAPRLAPNSAPAWNAVGRQQLLIGGDFAAATASLRRAVELNPYSARYWLDLASAYGISGQPQLQAEALQRAVADDHTTPEILWEAANLYLVRDEFSQAAPLFRRALVAQPYRLPEAVHASWRATHDLPALTSGLLGTSAPAYLLAAEYFVAHGDVQSATNLWSALTRLGQPLPAASVVHFVERLLAKHDANDAWAAWTSLPALDVAAKPYVSAGNERVVNGGFELPLIGGFDWRIESRPNVNVNVTDTEHHSGSRSVQVDFSGEPVSIAPLMQRVMLEPDTTYDFSGYMKAAGVLTTSGLRFYVSDADTSAQLFHSDDVIGTQDWKQLSGRFTTGPHTRLTDFWLARSPADRGILGTVWVDDISITRAR